MILRSIRLAEEHWEMLDQLAVRYDLPTRAAVVRRLIVDAFARDQSAGLSAGQVQELIEYLQRALQGPLG